MKSATQSVKRSRMSTVEIIFRYVLLALAVAYWVILLFGRYFLDRGALFYRSVDLFSGAGNPNRALRILSYVFFIISISRGVRFVLKRGGRLLKKGRAIIDIFCSLIKYTAAIILIFLALRSFGVDTTALLAGIGILGLVVGLGAQPLITDIIAGLFIVFENVVEVGDIIVVDGFRGTVREIGIRATQIEDAGGNIKVINNSDLRTLINMTENLSIACCEMSIEYGESLERVESVLKDNLEAVKEAIPEIVEGPYYKGVSELSDSAVILKFIAKCEEGSKYQVERDLNRQFKLLFDRHNINIPFRQVVVHEPTSFESASKSEQKAADVFVTEQRELSKNIPDAERPSGS